MSNDFLSLDLPALLTAVFASMTCALLGSFLVLRRQSLLGDAISHAVLPGIVASFLLFGTRSGSAMFLGAVASGTLAAVLMTLVERYGRVETGAAMGVIFSIFFASGIVLMEQAAARSVDLDADCVLYGQLEHVFWLPPADLSSLSLSQIYSLVPNELILSAVVMVVSFIVVCLFWKELRLASFDREFADSIGFSSAAIHLLLVVLVACAVVASFQVAGSILVIALLICPAATARLLTDRLGTHAALSVLVGALSAICGYFGGAWSPSIFGTERALSAAGMIAVASGMFLTLGVLFGPRYGLIARGVQQLQLTYRIAVEDLLGFLYRLEERANAGHGRVASRGTLRQALGGWRMIVAERLALRDRLVTETNGGFSLTEHGRERAKKLVRTHRLWELFLVERMGLRPDHVHERAELLEHFTSKNLEQALLREQPVGTVDPHGAPIPSLVGTVDGEKT